MTEVKLFKFGAWAAIGAAIIGAVGNIVHPRVTDFANYTEANLTKIASSDTWIPLHVVLALVILFAGAGLVALARSIEGSGGARGIAIGAAISGVAVGIVTIGVDGYAMKHAADSWAGATGDARGVSFAVAEAVSNVGWGLFMLLVMTLFGATPLAAGWAVLSGTGYPKWLGAMAILAGLGSLFAAIIGTIDGPSSTFFLVYLVFSLFTTLFLLIGGWMLWSKTKTMTTERESVGAAS